MELLKSVKRKEPSEYFSDENQNSHQARTKQTAVSVGIPTANYVVLRQNRYLQTKIDARRLTMRLRRQMAQGVVIEASQSTINTRDMLLQSQNFSNKRKYIEATIVETKRISTILSGFRTYTPDDSSDSSISLQNQLTTQPFITLPSSGTPSTFSFPDSIRLEDFLSDYDERSIHDSLVQADFLPDYQSDISADDIFSIITADSIHSSILGSDPLGIELRAGIKRNFSPTSSESWHFRSKHIRPTPTTGIKRRAQSSNDSSIPPVRNTRRRPEPLELLAAGSFSNIDSASQYQRYSTFTEQDLALMASFPRTPSSTSSL